MEISLISLLFFSLSFHLLVQLHAASYDFYLVSQSTRIGTVTPTSYNVIEDEVALSPGKLQMLTYKNCHLYYNWSGTVRVPAVVQYAHKLAFLVGQYIHDVPISEMGELGSLYFL